MGLARASSHSSRQFPGMAQGVSVGQGLFPITPLDQTVLLEGLKSLMLWVQAILCQGPQCQRTVLGMFNLLV